MLWAFVMIFIFCGQSEEMINEFETFNHKLGECNWYSLPLDIQRMYLIFISNTQQPKIIQGYGNILFTRDTFKKVIFSNFNEKLKTRVPQETDIQYYF